MTRFHENLNTARRGKSASSWPADVPDLRDNFFHSQPCLFRFALVKGKFEQLKNLVTCGVFFVYYLETTPEMIDAFSSAKTTCSIHLGVTRS